MHYKWVGVALLVVISLPCYGGLKKRLKKMFSCVHGRAASQEDHSFDSPPLGHRVEDFFSGEVSTYNHGGWNRKMFLNEGILPEDIEKDPRHPEKAAYERLLQEAMES